MDSNGQILFFPEKEYQGTVEEVKQEMIDYVHNKYPDLEFKVLSFEPRQFAHSNYEIMWVLPSDSLPKQYFSVIRHERNDIEDDYVFVAMSQKMQPLLQAVIEENFPGAKYVFNFFCTEKYPPQDLMPDMDYGEFIKWGFDSHTCDITCEVYVCANSYEELNQDSVNKTESQLVQLAPCGTLTFIGTTQDNLKNFETDGKTGYSSKTGKALDASTIELFSKSLCWDENKRWEVS